MAEQVNRKSKQRVSTGRVVALAFALTPVLASSALAASPVPLGTADSFAVLGGSTITNTGPTSVTGGIGLCCTGVATPGFGSVTQSGGAQYLGPATVAATAQDDLDIAYANAAGQAVTNTVPVDLSLTGTPASPLLPGVYESTAHGALQINTGLTLDFQGNPNAVFIFQGIDLTTAAGAGGSVNIVNGGSAPSTCNVYWQLSDPTQGVTLGAGSAFKGTTMALGASVLGTGATVVGRVLTRRSTAVNLDTNTITRSGCFGAPASGGGAPTSTAPIDTAPTTTPGRRPTSSPRPKAGTAQLLGPRGTVHGRFTVWVTGRGIASVIYSIDGKRVGTVRAKPGRKKFKLTITPRQPGGRVHRVTARVTFTRASRTRMTTLALTYRRFVASRPPRFTG